MKEKKLLKILSAVLVLTFILSGCGTAGTGETNSTPSESTSAVPSESTVEPQNLKVAAFVGGYGDQMWKDVVKAFEDANPNVTVELTLEKELEDAIGPAMKAGDYPDVVYLALGRPDALTETMVKENGLLELTDVLEMTVPGENAKVKDKIVPGFLDTLATNPYSDGKTYLAPVFYSPCGLFYNAGLFKEKGWEIPQTWDEMWKLGDKAKAEGISLFTYPTAGYLDGFMFASFAASGGPELFNSICTYGEGVWDTAEARAVFDILGKLAEYTEPTTVGNANNENFKKNQQLVLDNKALFMPNGTWIVGEMADSPRADGFEWGFTALPALAEGGDRYSYTFFEQVWIPKAAENQELAKKFVAYLYSDEAAQIFAKSGAIQPIIGISSMLEGDNKLFYSIYDSGAKAVMGGFAATDPVEGVNMHDVLYTSYNSVVSGDKTVGQWIEGVKEASNKLRAALK